MDGVAGGTNEAFGRYVGSRSVGKEDGVQIMSSTRYVLSSKRSALDRQRSAQTVLNRPGCRWQFARAAASGQQARRCVHLLGRIADKSVLPSV